MDNAKDGGKGWRNVVKPKLWQMGIGVIDPCDKPCIGYDEDSDLHNQLQKCAEEGNWDELVRLAKPIVGNDLRSQHLSAFLILYIDKETFMFGTTVEFAWAVQQRKPILIVCKQGKKNVPLFAFGMTPHSMMFSNFDEMFIYLDSIDNGTEIDSGRRWYFFDYDKIFGRNKNEIEKIPTVDG